MSDRASPQARRAAAINHLWRADLNGEVREPYLYALLDAARDPAIYQSLRRFAPTTEIASLYQGTTATELATVAPYLVCLGTGTRVFDWIWQHGWGQSWGVFLWSLLTFEGLRGHFRKLTKVRSASGEVLLFRFYDPRVLSALLPTCDAAQLSEIFGPVQCYFTETADGEAMTRFSLGDDTLRQQVLPLA